MASQSNPLFPEIKEQDIPKGFHDLSHRVNFTLSPGTVVPVVAVETLPGDNLEYGVSGQLESFPMLAPCLDGFKYRTLYFHNSLSNFYGFLDNNSKMDTSDFVSRSRFWSFIPYPLLYRPGMSYPTGADASGTETNPFINPSLASALNVNGVAPGSLLNSLGCPLGFRGLYTDRTRWKDNSDPSDSVSIDAQHALRVNLHKVFAYMDSYRISLANLQESNCYYIGVTLVNPGYAYKEDGTRIVMASRDANWHLDYGYKPVSLKSLDAFMSHLRYYTASPNHSISAPIPVDLDLSTYNGLRAFVVSAVNYMCNIQGANILSAPTPASESVTALSALGWFLEITGLAQLIGEITFTPDFPATISIRRVIYGSGSLFVAAQYGPRVPNSGYFLSTHEMDLNRGVLGTNVGLTRSSVDSSSGSFTIDAFRFGNSVQKVIDRFDVSGGRFSGWLRKLWSVKADSKLDTAELLHVTSSFIGNTDILSTAATEGAGLAQQAGYTIGSIGGKFDRFRCDDYGVFMAVSTLVPIVSYSQGINPSDSRLSLNDCFLPQYANIGFQDVPLREFTIQPCCLPSVDSTPNLLFPSYSGRPESVVARRAAWQDYRTMVDRSFGNFAAGAPLSYWTQPRFYNDVDTTGMGPNGTFSDSATKGYTLLYIPGSFNTTTYVWPRRYNYLFTQTDDSAQNFRVSARITLKGTRLVPSPQMPSL